MSATARAAATNSRDEDLARGAGAFAGSVTSAAITAGTRAGGGIGATSAGVDSSVGAGAGGGEACFVAGTVEFASRISASRSMSPLSSLRRLPASIHSVIVARATDRSRNRPLRDATTRRPKASRGACS
jgi:hypothetical protein